MDLRISLLLFAHVRCISVKSGQDSSSNFM